MLFLLTYLQVAPTITLQILKFTNLLSRRCSRRMTVWVGLHSKLAQFCVEKSIISWRQMCRILRSSWRKSSLIMQTSSFNEAQCRDYCQPKKVKERFTCPCDRNYPARYQFSVSSVSGCSGKMFSHIFSCISVFLNWFWFQWYWLNTYFPKWLTDRVIGW